MKKIFFLGFILITELSFGQIFRSGLPQAIDNTATPSFKGAKLSKQISIPTVSTGVGLYNISGQIKSIDSLGTIKVLSTNDYTSTEKTKLAGVATGATANSSDATLLARANHTGTQTSSTISDFNTASDARVVAGITGKANLTGDNVFIGVNAFTGTTATDTAPLGSELLTSSNWTSTGWTGSFATGWVHTTGNTTVLSNTLAASNATFYQIAYTVTGRTAGSFDISFGGVNTTVQYTGASGILTTSTGTLSITPTSTFDGTVIISIKTIGTSTALVTYKNSNGAVINEVRNTVNNVFYGVNSGRRNSSGDSNSAFGSNSFSSNTSGFQNSAFGNNSLQNNTIGNFNSAFAQATLKANTTGSKNTTFGVNSLSFNITGNDNSAVGFGALSTNTTGNQNTALGSNSLSINGTGSNNIALGYQSARFISGGSVANTITNNSIFLGANTYPLADNQTNQIVIGYGAVGNGSNTTVLGNTSTTQTQIFGNTILSNTAQATDTGEKLQVNGTSKFTSNVEFNGSINTFGNTLANNQIKISRTTSNPSSISIQAFSNAPNIQFSGIWMGFSNAANTELIRLWDGGNIGIGTISDGNSAYKLDVNGAARFVNGVNLATTSGNVGIGTTTPTSKLQVVGLPVYESNTLALAGGLTAGAFYRTALGVLMVAF